MLEEQILVLGRNRADVNGTAVAQDVIDGVGTRIKFRLIHGQVIPFGYFNLRGLRRLALGQSF